MRRTWIKMWVMESIEGSIRYQLDPAERSVWYDLVLFSAWSARPGIISDKDSRPYPHKFIANRLNIPVPLLEKTLKKCQDEGRIQENSDGIHIVNWERYQSEYQRQKPYRQKALTSTSDPEPSLERSGKPEEDIDPENIPF